MLYCDRQPSILEWGSEEIVIPYISPLDNRPHRYFPDFYIKYQTNSGEIRRDIVEVKPKRELRPPKPQTRKTKKYINSLTTFAVNQAKWKAAEEYCKDRKLRFIFLTEDHLKT